MAGILGFVFSGELETYSTERALNAIDNYRQEGTGDFSGDVNSIVDFLQNQVGEGSPW